MKKNEIKIGAYYQTKVSDKLTTVHIISEHPQGQGWDAINTKTGKRIRIKSAQRLRMQVTPQGKPVAKGPAAVAKFLDRHTGSPKGDKKAHATKDTNAKTKADTGERGAKTGKKLGLLSAAVQVLGKLKRPMSAKEMVEQVQAEKLWAPSRGGKTPDRTLYSAILREIQNKGDASRFEKTERGQFALK